MAKEKTLESCVLENYLYLFTDFNFLHQTHSVSLSDRSGLRGGWGVLFCSQLGRIHGEASSALLGDCADHAGQVAPLRRSYFSAVPCLGCSFYRRRQE